MPEKFLETFKSIQELVIEMVARVNESGNN